MINDASFAGMKLIEMNESEEKVIVDILDTMETLDEINK